MPEPTEHADTPPTGVAVLLRERSFGSYFVGKLLSSCGIWIQNIAGAVLMFELTRSAFMVGLVSMVQFAGPLVLALWSGGWSDRFDRRLMLMVGRVLSGGAVGVLSLSLFLRGLDGFGGPPALLAAVGVMGLGLAISNPAMQALVPALVRDEALETALALNAGGASIARTIGPAIGTALLFLGGPALAFAAAALGHGFFAFALIFLVRPLKAQQRPKQRPDLLGGFRHLWRDRRAGRLVLGIAFLGFGTDPIVTLAPSLADALGRGSETVGVFATAFGIGGVLCTFLFGRVRRVVSLWSTNLAGIGITAVGLLLPTLGTLALTTTGFFLAGGGLMLSMIAINTEIQRQIPDHIRGRVMALWGVAWLGSRPFAALVNGALGDLVSPAAGLVATAGFVLFAGVVCNKAFRERSN